jgi:hypothetical protein
MLSSSRESTVLLWASMERIANEILQSGHRFPAHSFPSNHKDAGMSIWPSIGGGYLV